MQQPSYNSLFSLMDVVEGANSLRQIATEKASVNDCTTIKSIVHLLL